MAIYDTSYIGTSTNRITFNNYDGGTPIYRIVSRAPQRRQIRDLDIPIPFESGISDFETLTGKYAYVIEGVMYPGSENEFDQGLRALRKVASLDIAQDDALADEGYVPYSWTEFNTTKQVFVKVLYVDIREDTRKGLVQPFRFICKIKDPVIHGGTLKTASTQGSDPTTASGSATYPFEYPIIYGASTYSVTSTAINSGDMDAYPQTIKVVGPVNQPTITNVTTGEFITVARNLGSSSNILSITYDKDSVSVTLDGNSVISSVTSASTYFKYPPGANELTLTGSSIGSGAYVETTFYDAYPLS